MSRKAVSLAQQGRFNEAIGCFDRALEEDPANVKMWNNKGVFLDLIGKDQDALACWEKALAIDPGFAPAWVSRGMLYRRR
ncbi:tetratricopeptide repeat protein, partial [Methanoculleus sp.]